MLQIENVLKTDVSAYAVSVGYRSTSGSAQIPDDDRAVATVRELLHANIAGIRQTALDANTAVSTLQTLDAAVTAIREKLARTQALAREAATGHNTNAEKTHLQQQVKSLAAEINTLVENTEHLGNKLLTANGQTISFSLGKGSTINILPRDLTLNLDGLDLTTNATAAQASFQAAAQTFTEYGEYLGRQTARMEQAMAAIELRFGKVMGIESSDFDTNIAEALATGITDNASMLLQNQANVSPARAAHLLEYRAQYTPDVK